MQVKSKGANIGNIGESHTPRRMEPAGALVHGDDALVVQRAQPCQMGKSAAAESRGPSSVDLGGAGDLLKDKQTLMEERMQRGRDLLNGPRGQNTAHRMQHIYRALNPDVEYQFEPTPIPPRDFPALTPAQVRNHCTLLVLGCDRFPRQLYGGRLSAVSFCVRSHVCCCRGPFARFATSATTSPAPTSRSQWIRCRR
jgi:hypothetical protein